MQPSVQERQYILFDSRAADGMGTEEASVLVACESDEEACDYKGDFGGMACYSYAVEDDKLVGERFEWCWFPGDPK